MAVLWTLVHLLALVSISMAGEFLTCPADQTDVKTPYIYDNSLKYADCPELIGAYVDWYQVDYRAECQRWMGLATPPAQVENAYISECHKYTNGTLRYRAEVCCPGAVQAMRCFTCTNATDQYSCNYHGTVETCATGEVCSTVFNYYGSNGQYCKRYITKGCMADQTCSALMDENPTKCKSYVDDPRCAYCHDERFGNWPTSTSHTYFYCGSNPCTPNPCRYGYCVVNSTLPSGYYCTCYGYSWLDSNGHCPSHVCQAQPCQNEGLCYLQSSPSPYYKCCCKQGWTGFNCSQAVSTVCTSNPGYCKNGGTCHDYGTAGLRCKCPTGWVGEQCETSSDVTCMGGPSALHVQITWSNSWTSARNCSSYRYSDSWFLKYACPGRMKRSDGPLFKNGVHGLVTKTEFNGLKSCAAVEKCFFFVAQACCPTCMSAPCLNGGWCVQKTNHDYVCKCRFGFEGKHCENKVAMCVSSGDPHYQTFDESLLHFQGTCLYNMATPSQEYPGLTYFQVLTKNEHRYGNTQVSYPKYYEVRVLGQKIRLDKGKRAYVNGVEVFPDVSYPGFKITNNGNFLRLETNFSLVVEYDGNWIGIVKLPDEYRDKMGGLCADFNGDPSNDYTTCTGIDVSDSPTRSSEIGQSCAVHDPSDPNCTDTPNNTVCEAAIQAELQTNRYCGYIKDTSGLFAACIAADPTTAAHALENCVMDTCMVKDRDTSCRSMEAFVTLCRNKGYGPPDTWRDTVNCPATCPTGMTYYASTSACHATCANPLAETECGLPDTESCKCPNGTVLHERTCQDPAVCGCLSLECPDGQQCKIVNGQAACVSTDGNWGSWGEWGDCSLPYRKGEQRRYRKCNNPAPSLGGKPCAGSRSQIQPCVCKSFYAAEDCKRCDETNNPAGYLPDPCSCDHYYQCSKYYGLWNRASLRECAPCTCWDQDKLTCVWDQSKDPEDCPVVHTPTEIPNTTNEICTRGANTHRADEDKSWYQWLVLGTWQRRLCPPGTVFALQECGCVFGHSDGPTTPAREEFSLTFDQGWDGFATSTGLYVQPDNVVRVKDGVKGYASQFNGKNSTIKIPYFTNNEFSSFSFSLWFKRTGTRSGEQGLVYNGDCDEEGSIQIRSESYNTVGAGIMADHDLRKVFSGVKASGNSWNHLVLTYDGTQLKFYVNKSLVIVDAETSGPTLSIHCPLVLGFKYAVDPQPGLYFSGLMDEVFFYKEAISQDRVNKLFDVTRTATIN